MASSFEQVIDAMKVRNALMRAKNRPEWRSLLLGTMLGLIIGITVVTVAAMCFTVNLQKYTPSRILSRKSWSSNGRSPFRTIGVILDETTPIQQQKDMMAAVQAAAEYIGEERPYHPLKIRQIHLPPTFQENSNENHQVETLLKLAGEESISVFIDLRLSQLSTNATEEICRKIPGVKFISPYPTVETLPSSNQAENATSTVSIGGSIKGQMIAIISKMQQAGSTLILPIVANDQRLKESFDIFKSESGKRAPGINVLSPIDYSLTTINDIKDSSSPSAITSEFNVDVVLDEIAEACSKHPSVSLLLFSEAEVVQLLAGTYRKPEVAKRIWYFPDGLFWEDDMRSREDAWKVARQVGMVSAGFLGVNETDHFRYKRMMHLNSKLGKGSPLHATLAFDSLLVAYNALVSAEYSSNDTQQEQSPELKFFKGISGDLSDVDERGNRGSVGDYARAMLLPDIESHLPNQQKETTAKLTMDVLHDSPWLPDGVALVNEAEEEGKGITAPLIKATSGHFLKKSYLKKFYERSRYLKCTTSTVKVQAMDFLTHAKIERRYNATDFPEAIILPGDHGFTIQLLCHGGRNNSSLLLSRGAENSPKVAGGKIDAVDDLVYEDDDEEGTSSFGVHFVCPPEDPVVRLPCIHSLTSGRAEEGAAKSVEYEEVPREHMQRYFDAFGLEKPHPSTVVGSVTPVKLDGRNEMATGSKRNKRQISGSISANRPNEGGEQEQDGTAVDYSYGPNDNSGYHQTAVEDYPQYEDYADPYRFPAANTAGANTVNVQRPADGQNQFQRRKSSIPGGYEMKMHEPTRQKPASWPATSTSVTDERQTTGKPAYGTVNYADDQTEIPEYEEENTFDSNDSGYVPQYNIQPLDDMLEQKVKELNASAFENLDSWYPTVLSKLAETYGVKEQEVQEVLKMTRGTYLPTLMRRDAAPVPAKPPQKYPYPPYAKWLGSSVTSMGSCIGASLSCIFCTMLVESTGYVSYICNGACYVGIYGNCLAVLGLLYSKVYASNSVICTELFRQGKLDLPTYMADAQFGARLRIEDKRVLDGYHTLAKPVVWAMQQSETVTNLVEAAATPWVKQMAHEEGLTEEGNDIGRMMMDYGVPFCAYVGVATAFVTSCWQQLAVGAVSLGALLAIRFKEVW